MFPRPFVTKFTTFVLRFTTRHESGSNPTKSDQSGPTPFLCGTVTALPPTRLCRIAVLLVKPTFLSSSTEHHLGRDRSLIQTNVCLETHQIGDDVHKETLFNRVFNAREHKPYSPSPLRALASRRYTVVMDIMESSPHKHSWATGCVESRS